MRGDLLGKSRAAGYWCGVAAAAPPPFQSILPYAESVSVVLLRLSRALTDNSRRNKRPWIAAEGEKREWKDGERVDEGRGEGGAFGRYGGDHGSRRHQWRRIDHPSPREDDYSIVSDRSSAGAPRWDLSGRAVCVGSARVSSAARDRARGMVNYGAGRSGQSRWE